MDYSNRTIANIVLLCYLLGIITYFVLTLDTAKITNRENRLLEPFPALRGESKINKHWAVQVENYICDHLSVRDELIDFYGALLSVMDHQGNDRVFVGKDGWLFGNFAGNSHNFSMTDYYQRKVGFTPQQMAKIKSDLIKVKQWTAARGIRFYVYFPPDKQTIYQEFYPPFIKRSSKPTLAKQVEEYLQDEIDIILLEDAFLKSARHNKERYLHYKTESHWSPTGAYLAYRLLMQQMARDVKGLRALNEQELSVSKTSDVISNVFSHGQRRISKGNLYEMLGKPSYIQVDKPLYEKYTFKKDAHIQVDGEPPFETSFYPQGQNYNVYLIGDSYSDYLFPFLSATFQAVKKVRINQGKWGIRFKDRQSDILGFETDILLLGISDLKLIELLKIME